MVTGRTEMGASACARLKSALLEATSLTTSGSRLALAAVLAMGVVWTAPAANAANFSVGNEAQLRNAISSAQNGDTITFTANITLSDNLPHVQRDVTINGGSFTLSGNNKYRGLYVEIGTVAISDLTIANTLAQGGKGGDGRQRRSFLGLGGGFGGGGGGGAGLGGAIFVGGSANVTVSNVNLQDNAARGGNGGGVTLEPTTTNRTSGGGGGMFGNGTNGFERDDGLAGAGGGGAGGGGQGGFGGGGGGAATTVAGSGGFGGGGGGSGSSTPGNGGFGGGSGHAHSGGGGAGLGGSIFIQEGGSLNLAGTLSISGGKVVGGQPGGAGAGEGKGFGSGMFLEGDGSLTLTPGAGQTQTISDVIADQAGVAGGNGRWSLVKSGAGTTILTGANAYSGGTIVSAGVLQGNTAGLQGNITNNASVVFDQTGSGTYAGTMSGTGTLTKIGAGDVMLTGTNSYAGGTSVLDGALLFKSDASLGKAGIGITLNNGAIGTAENTAANSNRAVTITNNGGFRADNFSTLTWSGVIGGSGKLVKSGNGTVILSGTNTYSGGTSVTGGVLGINSDANLGAAGTGITLSDGGAIGSTKDTLAATSFGQNITITDRGGINVALHPITWSGDISGVGQLSIKGSGEVELTGTNTYRGGTRLEGGTLRISSDDKLGAAGSSVVFDRGALRASESFTTTRDAEFLRGGAFLVDANKVLTWNGIVSGAGHLTKVGDGTLVLAGANTYTGDLYNNGGTVQGNATSLRGDLRFDPNEANPIARSVIFDQMADGTFGGKISGIGSLTKTGTGKLTLTGANTYSKGTTVSAGTLQGNSNSLQGNILNDAALIFDQSDTGTYGAIISGTGTLEKIGAGKLMLPGIHTYTGETDINAGNLNVNGSLESSSVVNVNVGGTLSGTGKFGNVNNNGGTISPGNSIGTIVIGGNFNMGPKSKYYIEINGVASDRIEVGGTANIQSSIFEIAHDTDTTSAPVLPGTTYTIITTKGGLTTTAPTVAVADFPFLAFTLSNDGFNGYLTTSRSADAFATLASTPNEKAVANALDAAGSASPLWQQVVGATEAQARTAFTSLGSAAIHANVAGVLSAQSHYLRDAVTDRLRQDFAYGTALAPASNALAYAPEARNAYAAAGIGPFYKAPPVAAPVPALVYAAWAQGLGSWGALKGDGNAGRTDHSLGGVISGLDATFNGQWRVGLAGGYSRSIFKSPGIAASGSSDNYHIALYGGGQVGAFGVRGGASFSWNDVLTSRHVAVVNLAGDQRGDYAATTTQVFGEIGYSATFGAAALEPFANVAYVQVNGTVNELGAVAMTGSSKLDTTYTTLGVRGAVALTETLRARGTLGWRHAFGDITPVAALAFQSGGAAFTLAGSPIARDAVVAEAGLDLAVAPNASLGISWSGQFSDRAHDNTVKGNFTWRF